MMFWATHMPICISLGWFFFFSGISEIMERKFKAVKHSFNIKDSIISSTRVVITG